MPQVVVTIDAKTYRMACGEGEEAHLTALAADIDGKIAELKQSFGQIGDLRLTVMAAIMTADELSEAKRKIRDLEGGIEAGTIRSGAMESERRREQEQIAERLHEAAASLERISTHLNGSGR